MFMAVCVCCRYNLVYVCMVISGIGTLMPWNMFITATAVSTVTVPGSQSPLTVKNSAILNNS